MKATWYGCQVQSSTRPTLVAAGAALLVAGGGVDDVPADVPDDPAELQAARARLAVTTAAGRAPRRTWRRPVMRSLGVLRCHMVSPLLGPASAVAGRRGCG